MERLRCALADVRQLLEPAVGFTSGLKVAEPDPADTSDEAKLKRQILELASVAKRRAEWTLAGEKPADSLVFDADLFHQIERRISAAEQDEFNALASAVEQLISEIDARTT